jgi:integrase/recombinase XerD
VNALTLSELIDTLVAARRAGGFRYDRQARVLAQFAEHCRREGYADGSIIQEAVEGFLYGRHLKASTIRREEIILRDLAEHARQFGWPAWAPPTLTRLKTRHRPPPYVFSDEEIRRLFHAIDTQPLSEMSNRALVDPVLFRVLYAIGLRLSEALNLQLRDLDQERATLEVRDSKNRENRIVPVTRRLADTLGHISRPRTPIQSPLTICSTPAIRPSRPTSPRSTTGCAATSPMRTFPISPRAARTSIRCVTGSPCRTCVAGPLTAATWR